ncbi:MAG: hypothetical protein M3Y87_09705, partial [Myxococcota bacterium]|nr:hypothetical protein [Myxococcota bacterium]
FGPFATALPIRLRLSGAAFAGDLRATDAELSATRAHAMSPHRIARAIGGAPSIALGAQLFVTYLDFDALSPAPRTSALSLRVDDSRTDMTPPPAGTDLVVAARPVEGALRITLRSDRDAWGESELDALAESIEAELRSALPSPSAGPACHLPALGIASAAARTIDAALVGYLPPIAHIAAIAGLGSIELETLRARVRATVFPENRARVLETVDTPLGRSAFVCLPRFADELTPSIADALAIESAEAVRIAARAGARCVSLAGMIPSLTGYGLAVQRALGESAPSLTTGHAATAVSVVLTALSALDARPVRTLAIVGAGSIGRASLMLLLARLSPAPARLILCDVAGVRERLDAIIDEARAVGWSGDVVALASDERAPDAIYEADLVIAATSTPAVIDPDRLRPGAIVIDDSFPPALDTARAIARMRTIGDVIVSGGGLLECGRAERRALVDIAPSLAPPPDLAARIASQRPAATIASCQLESLLCARDPSLPRVMGLVTPAQAARYWDAIERAGVRAGPLHLGDHLVAKKTT